MLRNSQKEVRNQGFLAFNALGDSDFEEASTNARTNYATIVRTQQYCQSALTPETLRQSHGRTTLQE